MNKMHFDVVLGNPPYQEETSASKSRQARPLYHDFITAIKKLTPECMSLIIPSRWFAGGMGLDAFREEMMQDKHLAKIVDYTNAKDCFPNTSISGGVCYFIRDVSHHGDCEFTNIRNGQKDTSVRALDAFPILIRYNSAVSIIDKVLAKKESSLADIISPISPFGIPTNPRNVHVTMQTGDVPVYSSKGVIYMPRTEITKGEQYFGAYKVLLGKTSGEHACEPGRNGKFNVLTRTMRTLQPHEACTHSYIVLGPMKNHMECENLISYLKTKFARFLLLQALSSIDLTRKKFAFIPMQDFSHSWHDAALYLKYGLDKKEQDFIDDLINPLL